MNPDPRLRLMRRLAWACVLLMLVVTSASAWLRLAQPRPACADWPGCRSVERPVLRLSTPAVLGQPRTIAAVRGTHRVAASAVLVLALALAALAWVRPPRRRAAGALAIALLAFALGLSVLGIVTPGSRAAGVMLGNLLGGLLMLGLAWRLVCHLDDRPPPARPLAIAAGLGAVLWAAQAALGALAGAGLAPAAPVAHLVLALCALPWAAGVGWRARRHGRPRTGAALIALAAAQAALGAAAVAGAAPMATVLLHNVAAALGLALLMGLALPPEHGRGARAWQAAASTTMAP